MVFSSDKRKNESKSPSENIKLNKIKEKLDLFDLIGKCINSL